jgi:Ger(x)C family germination protein
VLGFGIDADNEDGNYSFTFQLAVPVSGSSDSSDAIEYINCSVTDHSAASAIRSLEKDMGRQINFEQLTAIIIGEDLSHDKFTQITELFFRRASVRRQSCIAVCTGTAQDFFNSTATSKSISSDAAIALQSYDGRSGTGSMAMNLHSLYTAVSNHDEFYLLKISEANADTAQDSLTEQDTDSEKNILSIDGAASYSRSGEYLGEISGSELETLRLISNRQTSGIISAANADSENKIYYQIKESHCDTTCGVYENTVNFQINLHVQCSLVDGYGFGQGDVTSAGFTDSAEKCIINSLTEEIGSLSEKSRSSLGSSVLGLQDTLRQHEPEWYEQNSNNWEEIYSSSKISINISCEIIGGGLTQ